MPRRASRLTKRARLVSDPIRPTASRSGRRSAAATISKSSWWSCVITSTRLPGGKCGHRLRGLGGAHRHDVGRQVGGQRLGPRIDPADPARQVGQQFDQRLADMAGAEQRRSAARGGRSTSNSTVTWPPQHCPSAGPSGKSRVDGPSAPEASRPRAAASHWYSRLPPPIVPARPSAETTILAPASRGVEPLADSTVTSTAGWLSRSAAARASSQAAISRPPGL